MPSNTTLAPNSLALFTSDGVHFDGLSASGTATAGTTTHVDLKLTDDMLLTGGLLLAKGCVFGDSVVAQVVDVDNVLGYGAGVVLNQFVSWILPDSPAAIELTVPYPSKIFAGLYIRIAYTSTGVVDVLVAINYMTHKVML